MILFKMGIDIGKYKTTNHLQMRGGRHFDGDSYYLYAMSVMAKTWGGTS